MQYSTNFNMNKPELNEQYRLNHWNDNTDIIDTEMQAIRSGTDDVIKETLLNFCYPIGSIYWSGVATNPHDLFGGTWVQIKDKFVWAKGDSDVLDATGGEKTHTLTSTEMPSHTHTFTGSAVTSGANNRGHTHSVTASGTISGGAHTHTLNNGNTSSAGTTTTAGIRFVAVTSGGSSTDNTGAESSHTHSVGAHSHPIGGNTGGAYAQLGSSANPSGVTTSFSTASAGAHRHDLYGATQGNNMQAKYWSISTYTLIGYAGSGSYFSTTLGGTAYLISEAGSHSHTIYQSTHSHSLPANTSNSTAFNSSAGSSHSHTMKHTHSVTASGYIYGKTDSATPSMTFTGSAVTSGAESQNHTHSVTASGTNGNTGGGGAHNNMPPYVVKYCWQRTA